jgi:hypothetical protein
VERRTTTILRSLDIALCLLAILVAAIASLNPSFDTRTVVVLLTDTTLLYASRMILASGFGSIPRALRGTGIVGGLAVIAIVGVVLLDPSLGLATLVGLFGAAMTVQGLERLVNALNRDRPVWFRASALAVGGSTIFLVALALSSPHIRAVSLVAILTLTIFLNGIEGIVSGVRPSSARQLTLIKLIAFSVFYGFVNVNWIDLYFNRVPAYHIWLIVTYLAPFGVLLVFRGLKDWQLAASLGLLVSLENDLGYYFSGDLFFGFRVNLVQWLSGQLGFEGNRVLFTFQGGLFSFPVTSFLMGFSVYARAAVVVLVLYHWWITPSTPDT